MKGHFACLLVLVPGIFSGPVPQSTCASECLLPLNPKFQYEVGKAYVYNYQATTETAITGTSKDNAVVTLNGVATVSVLTPCDFSLQLTKTKVQAADEKVDVSALEKRALLFAFRDGTIESVCPYEDDPAWVLNVKKAVLSLLQHTPDSLKFADSTLETDISGRCPTNYTLGDKGAILKTRDLTLCSNRLGRFSAVPTVPYTAAAQTQTVPILRASSECRLVVNKGIVESSQCIETHLLRPLSAVAGGGAQTKVVASLTFQSAGKASSFKAANLNQETLLFNPALPELGSSDRDLVVNIVKDVCKALTSEGGNAVPSLFSQLVHAVRRCSQKDLKAAYDKITAKKFCTEAAKVESIFLDSLPNAGTPGAVMYMTQLINEGKVSDARSRSWYVHLHFTKYPSKEAMKAMFFLIDKPQPLPQALIGVSGYAKKVCETLGGGCATDPEIQVLTVKLSKHLGAKCKAKDFDEEKKILATLKALGNIGAAHKDVHNTVRDCIKDATLPVPTRLAAVQAFRSRPCETSDLLLDVLADINENVEVRLAAYLGALKCPTHSMMKRIQDIVQKEQVNQVGSFIQSHLDNIKNNPNPGKQALRKLVRSVSHGRSFPFDFRKFSRNLNFAHFCTVDNAGWDVDANIIYTPESYLPRSASLNVTLDLFGQSMNLFELGGRFEGLEYLVESYFGPEGIYRANDIQKTASDRLSNLNDKLWSRLNGLLRPKRATVNKAELDAISKSVGLDKAFYASPKGDLFLRLFGAEVASFSYRRGFDAPDADFIFDKIFGVLNRLIDGAKNEQVDIARSVMFLDRISTFPTASGLPLRLALNGTASFALNFESQIDIRAILRDPKTASIGLTVVPLIATEISAAMGVDINNLRSGVKTVLNLHSSIGEALKVSWHQGKSFEFKLDLPKTKMTVVEAKSELFVFRQKVDGVEKAQKIAVLNAVEYKRGACVDNLSTFLGLRYCRQYVMQVPPAPTAVNALKDLTPIFPLSGHFLGSIYIEKTEPSMTGIYLLASGSQADGKTVFEFTFDTPGSKTDRKILFKGTGFNTNSRVGVEGKAKQFGKDYEAKLYVDISRSSSKADFSPVVEYTLPDGKKDVLVAGRITIEGGKKVTFNVSPSGSLNKVQLGASGSAEFEFSGAASKISLKDIKLTTPFGNSGFGAQYARELHSLAGGLDLIYGQNNKVGFAVKITDKSNSPVREYGTEIGFKSTKFPFLSFDFGWDFKMTPENLENGIVFVFGAESESKNNRITVKQYRKRRGSIDTKDLVIENKVDVKYPGRNFDFKVDQSLNYYPQKLDGRLKVEYGGKSILSADLLANIKRDLKTLYDAKFKAEYPGRVIEVYDQMQQVSEHIYKSVGSVEFKPGSKYDVISLVTYDKRSDHVKFEVDADIKPNYTPKPFKLKTYLLLKDKYAFVTRNKFEGDGVVKFLLDGRYDPTATEPELVIETNLFGRVEGKLAGKLGRSEKTFDLGVFVPRFDRKISLTALARTGGEFRRVEAAFAWDALKDKSKQVAVEISARLPPTEVSADVRAGLTVIGNRYNAGFAGTLGRGFFADHTGRVELELPGMKKAVLGIRASNSKQADKYSIKGGLEASLPNGDEYKIDLDNRVTDLDPQKLTFAIQSDVKFNTPISRDGLLHIELSRKINSAGIRISNARFTFAAPRLGNNIDGNVNLEVTSDSYKVTATGQRGPAFISVDSNGKITLTGNNINLNGVLEVKAPRLDWKEVKLSLISTNEVNRRDGTFDVSEKVNVFYAGNTNLAFEAKASNKKAWEGSLSLETPFQGYRRQILSTSYNGVPNKHDASVVLQWSPADSRSPAELKTDLLLDLTGDSFVVKAISNTPFKEYDQIEFRVDARTSNQKKTYDVDVRAGLSTARSVKVTAKFDLQDKIKGIDLTLTAPGVNPYRFISNLAQGPDYKYEGRVEWHGKYIAATANGKITSIDTFDFKGTLDSPALNINKYEVVFFNKQERRKPNIVEFSVKKGSEFLGNVRMTYEKKESKTSLNVKGKVDIDLKKLVGKSGGAGFVYDDKAKAEFTLTLDMTGDLALGAPSGNRRVKYVVKNTVKERSFLRQSCDKTKDCVEITIYLKDASAKADRNYEFAVLYKQPENKKDATAGVIVKYKGGTEFENAVEYYYNKEANKFIGYKIYDKESETGVELFTAKRIIAANAVYETKSRVFSSSVKQKVYYNVWLDKKGKPDKKLTLKLSTEPHKLDDMEGFTWAVSLRHPAMKDIDITGEVHYGGKARLYHAKIDANVVSNVHKNWIVEGNVYQAAIKNPNGVNYTYNVALESKGKDLSVKIDGYRTVTNGSRVGATYLILKDGKNENVLLAKYELIGNHFGFKAGRPERQMGFSADWNVVDSASFPVYSFDASTSVLDLAPTIYSFEAAPFQKLQAKVYNNATPENHIFAFAGLQDDQTFDISLQHNLAGVQNDLLLTRIALASPRVLHTLQQWDTPKIRNLVQTVRNRRLAVMEEFEKRSKVLVRELKAYTSQWAAFETLPSVVDKVVADYKGQVADFKKDLDKDDSLKETAGIVREGYTTIAQLTGAVSSTAEDLSVKAEKAFEEAKKKVVAFFNSLPELLNRKSLDFVEAIEDFVLITRKVVGSILEISSHLLEVAGNKIEETTGIVSALKNVYVTLSGKFRELFADLQAVVTEKTQRLLQFVAENAPQGVDGRKLAESLKQFLETIVDKQKRRQAIYRFLEENVFSHWDAWRADFTKQYPEFTRPVYRFDGRTVSIIRERLRASATASGNDSLSLFELTRNQLTILGFEVTRVDGDAGVIDFKLLLPRAISTLRELDDSLGVFYFSGGRSRYSPLRDLLKKGEIIPPFVGYAAIIGSQGYVTFDGKVYDFNSNCQYLLARDFVDGNFSLVVSYDDSTKDGVPKKSLIVSDSNDQVEITNDYKVAANGKTMTTDFSLKFLNVRLTENGVEVYRTHKGFVLRCDRTTDVCVLELSGFYFGKTQGLFGTFNHEVADDWFKTDKKDSKSLADFVNSWKVSKQCKEKPVTLIATPLHLEKSVIYDQCEAFFGNTRSGLSSCFDVHDPAPFLKLCQTAVGRVRSNMDAQKSAACSVVSGYKAVCLEEGVKLSYFDACAAA